MVMTDQRSGTTPFNCVLVCVVLSPSPHIHRVTAACCKVCEVVILFPILCFGAFSSFLHLFRSAFFIFPTCCLLSPLWATCSPTYWYCSPRDKGFGRGCGMWSTILFCSLILYGGIRRSWCQEISIRIPNRHFPTWKKKFLPPVPFLIGPHLFPTPERVQPPDPTDRSRQ